MEFLWARLVLVASLFVTVTFQKSIWEEPITNNQDGEDSYRANYDSFPNGEVEGNESDCSCNWRHLIHYEAKGCIVVENDLCGCPTRFDCPDVNEIEEDNTVCTYKGKMYPSGSRINTSNPCERCRCSRGPIAEIVCYPVECPEFQNSLPPNCHHVYENNKCCPTATVCIEPTDQVQFTAGEMGTTCKYNGRIYPLGSRMYSADDPCEICPCSEEWITKNGTGCYSIDCTLEKKRAKLLEGCVPIYHQDTCCPVDFYCAPNDDFLSNPPVIEESLFKESGCMLGGKFYDIGESASVANQCVSCTCQVPPDLTCIQQKCQPNPNEKYCTPSYSTGGCCPSYQCFYADENPPTNSTFERMIERVDRELEDDGSESRLPDPEGTCFETQCSEGMTCLLYQVKCGNTPCSPVPTCLKTNISCLSSTCNSGCVVIEQNQDMCVTCACGKDIENLGTSLKCEMPQCSGQHCHLIGGDDGCPTCTCTNKCPELQCQPGCNVVLERESDCPKCICEDETEGCPTPICEHEGCRIVNLENGCPTCVCDRGRSISSGTESETNMRVQPPQQQQQQQQQQVDDTNNYENVPPTPEEYGDDDVMLMSGSSISQDGTKANLKERSPNLDYSNENIRIPKPVWQIMEDGDKKWNPEFTESKSLNSDDEYSPGDYEKESWYDP